MTINIYNNAVPDEAAKLRQEVFVEEQGFIDEFDEYDNRSTHLVMFDGDEPVATLRFYDEGNDSRHVGRVAVRKSRRGEGLGKILMDEAFRLVRASGAKKMTVAAQEDKSGFYARCGFTQVGERFYEQDYPHVNMEIVF